MEAIMLSAGTPAEDDLLFPYTNGAPKALILIGGKPMAQWVLDALDQADAIDRIHIVGLNEDCGLSSNKPVTFIPNHGGILENVQAGFLHVRELNPTAAHVLVTSSDIPTITGTMIDWRVRIAQENECEFHYAVVERSTMETRFPGSNRSYIRLKDVEVCGADMNVIQISTIDKPVAWQRLIDSRKNPIKQAAMIGWDTLLLILVHRLTLMNAGSVVSKRLGVVGRVAISPYAEIAMDVDKPHQLEIIRMEMEEGRKLPH
jgi:GTP:adenosylcobinamide-phosphate guanylyltransferase